MPKISPRSMTDASSDKLITSFPLSWGEADGRGDGPDILDSLLKDLRKRQRQPLLSIFDLASVIIQRCARLLDAQHEELPQEHDLLGILSNAVVTVVSIP